MGKSNSLFFILYNSFIETNVSDTDSESTIDSNRPSYMEKFENINKILANLETKCN